MIKSHVKVFKKIKLNYDPQVEHTPEDQVVVDPDMVNDTPLAAPVSMVSSQAFLANASSQQLSMKDALEKQGVSKFSVKVQPRYSTIQETEHLETQFLSKLEKSIKLKQKMPMAHCFAMVGVDPKEPEGPLKVIDYFPDVQEKP
jgi:hypothetical protein